MINAINTTELLAVLRAALVHASKDETRPHLHGILLETRRTGLRVVSTDGHRLFACDTPCLVSHPDRSAILSRKDAETLVKVLDRKLPEVAIQGPELAFLQAGRVVYSASPVDAQFPPYARVMPTIESAVASPRIPTALNPLYLADACKAIADMSKARGAKCVGVYVQAGESDMDPILVFSSEFRSVAIVIMPMRMHDTTAKGRKEVIAWQEATCKAFKAEPVKADVSEAAE